MIARAKPVLLVGNGPNRLEGRAGSPSWDQLMRDLALKSGLKAFNTGRKPLPLAFEEVLARGATTSGLREHEVKQRVAEVARDVQPNWIHELIQALPVYDILTTNYDYSLFAGPSITGLTAGSTETKYSLFRRSEYPSLDVWHIHG